MSTLLRAVFGLILWLSGVSLCLAEQDGLLIINVDLMRLNNQGGQSNTIYPASHYGIVNLTTRRSYQFSVFSTARVDVEGVEEGIYCLASASFANVFIDHCVEPYFKVVAGKVNNAGWWRLGYSLYDGSSKVIFAAKDLDEVLARAKTYYKDELRKYGMEVNP